MASFGDDLIRKYLAIQISFSKQFYFLYFFLFIYHFMREIASLNLNMKVFDSILGTLYVVYEENAAINENNRFTERFNFELAFNLPLSKLFKAYLSVTLASRACDAIFNHENVAIFRKIRVELSVLRAT